MWDPKFDPQHHMVHCTVSNDPQAPLPEKERVLLSQGPVLSFLSFPKSALWLLLGPGTQCSQSFWGVKTQDNKAKRQEGVTVHGGPGVTDRASQCQHGGRDAGEPRQPSLEEAAESRGCSDSMLQHGTLSGGGGEGGPQVDGEKHPRPVGKATLNCQSGGNRAWDSKTLKPNVLATEGEQR